MKEGSDFFYVGGQKVDSFSGASDFNTDALDLTSFNGSWVLYLDSTHTSGSPKITVECSPDGIDWFCYDKRANAVSIPETVADGSFLPKFMRISYTAGGSNGNVTFKLDKVT